MFDCQYDASHKRICTIHGVYPVYKGEYRVFYLGTVHIVNGFAILVTERAGIAPA